MANEIIPFNFDEIYSDLETKFTEKGYDSLYEGSNTAQLITAMTYLTSMLNTNTALNINELLLPLAKKRDNILQDARVLGYEISHKVSYQYDLELTFSAGSHYIPKYSEFIADGNTYYYMGDGVTLTNVSEGHTEIIRVKEGKLYKSSDYSTLSIISTEGQYYVDIPYKDVEESGIEVFLTYTDEFGVDKIDEQWTESISSVLDKETNLNKQYLREDNIEFKTPRLYFKLFGNGTELITGTKIDINVLVTKSDTIPMIDVTDNTVFSNSIANSTITSIVLVNQGSSEESLESVKTNAPMFRNSANRAVTREDYLAICNKVGTVSDTEVWGGDVVEPIKPGEVWFSFLPSNKIRTYNIDYTEGEFSVANFNDLSNWFVEDVEIKNPTYNKLLPEFSQNPGVFDILENYKIPTIKFNNRHPIYMDFEYTINILKYIIKTSKDDVHQNIFNVINEYFEGVNEDEPVESFSYEYFHSNIEKRIDMSLSDVTGFTNTVKTKLLITNKNLSYENDNSSDIDVFIPLSLPFEDIYDTNNNIIIEVLPNINSSFYLGNLSVNFNSVPDNAIMKDVVSFDIVYNGEVCGVYNIFNDYRKYISVQLFVRGENPTSGSVYENTPLRKVFFDNPQYTYIKYLSPNFRLFQNVIPRLKRVNFVYGIDPSKVTEMPIFILSDTSVNKNEQLQGQILNYDSLNTYYIDAQYGTIIQGQAGIFIYVAPNANSQIQDTVTMYATKRGEVKSDSYSLNVDVISTTLTFGNDLVISSIDGNSDTGFDKDYQFNDGWIL